MEIIRKPATRTVELRDIDIRFPGEMRELTLRPEDTLSEDSEAFRVTFAGGELLTIYKDKVLWDSRRMRVITEKVPLSVPVPGDGRA